MNKKLLALAVAGAFAAPAAMAQTNVTLYGTLAMSVDNADGGSGCGAGATDCFRLQGPTANNNPSENRWRVSSNTSYFGLRVNEDLGNGLSARAQLETALNVDTGGGIGWGGAVGNRNNFIGFASKSWGSVDLGLIDTPLKTSTAKLDLFGGGHTIADYRSLFVTRDSSVRAANSIYYTSPTFNGFTVRAQVGAQQEDGSRGSPRLWSVSGTYDNGPIFATLAFEETKKVLNSGTAVSIFDNGGGTIGVAGSDVQGLGTASDTEAKFKTWRAGFGYNFGPGKVGVAYQHMKVNASDGDGLRFADFFNTTNTLGTNTQSLGNSAELKRGSWHVSGEYNVTAATAIGLQYTRANKLKCSSASGLTCGDADTKASQWTLGVKHNLSKRTNVYALYTQVRNGSEAAYQLGGGATGTAAINPSRYGEDPKAFSLGVIHKF